MCSYCETIYKNVSELANEIYRAWSNEENYNSDGIVYDGKRFDIVIPDQDGDRTLFDIKYCPYCGRALDA